MTVNDRIYYSNEAARRAMTQRNILALLAAGLGLALGVVLTLVVAPLTNDKSRRAFGEHMQNLVSSGVETVGKVASAGAETVGRVASTVREQVEERLNHNH